MHPYKQFITSTMIGLLLGHVLSAHALAPSSNVNSPVSVKPGAVQEGDILYGHNKLFQRLAAGSNGQVLTLSGGVPSWAAIPSQLPSQTGNAGKYLTTDGTNASWSGNWLDNIFTLQNNGDTTKQAAFDLSGISTLTTRTYTLPDISDTIDTLNLAATLSNKLINNTNTVDIKDLQFALHADSDNTKILKFDASSIPHAFIRTLVSPNADGTIVLNDNTATLSNKSMSGSANTFTNIPLTTAVTGVLPVANGGSGQSTYTDGQLLIGNTATTGLSKATLTAGANITITNGNGSITIAAPGGGSSFNDSTFNVFNNTDNTKITKLDVSGVTTGTTRTLAVPDANGTLTLNGATQSLTNKTIDGGTNHVELFDNKLAIDYNLDPTAEFVFDASAISHANIRSIQVPDVSGVMSVGGPVLLSSSPATNVASLTITGLSSSYSEYVIKGRLIKPQTDAQDLQVFLSTDGGGTFKGNSGWVRQSQRTDQNTVSVVNNATEATGFYPITGLASNSASGSIDFELHIFNPGATINHNLSSVADEANPAASLNRHSIMSGTDNDSVAINAVKFQFASGNIVTGTFKLYGIP